MDLSLLIIAALTFAIGLGVFRLSIPLAKRFKLVDVPNARRRHAIPMPIIGGASLFIAWSIGLGLYCALKPEWGQTHFESLAAILTSVGILIGLGLVDDLKGVGPKGKLFFQFLAAAVVLAFEPKVHSFCLHWKHTVDFLIWPLAALWIVGLSNAINLVDGLDGLAGGISLLVAGSLAVLCARWGADGSFGLVVMVILMASVGSFLKQNWHPSKIFLGDNGSLPLGFLIGTVSLMNPDRNHSWVQILSLILMMGYPIMDMGLCTMRRFRHGNPLFKADRNHLHHRLLRFGLSVPQIGILLLSITFYLQLTSLCMDSMKLEAIVFYTAAVGFSLFSLLYLLRAIEHGRVKRISQSVGAKKVVGMVASGPQLCECIVARISLEPLFEAGIFEERDRFQDILPSLKLMLQTLIRKEDIIYVAEHNLNVVFVDAKPDPKFIETLSTALKEKLSLFQNVYNLQYSLSDLPVKFLKQPFMVHREAGRTLAVDDQAA